MPGIFQRHKALVNDMLSVSSADAVAEMKRLARSYGIFCGPSSGAHLLAAGRVRQHYPELGTVVTVFCDEGEKYLHVYFMQANAPELGAAHFQ